MNKKLLIGIDGGASYIRVAVSDLNGNLLSHIKWSGGAAIKKDTNANENMRNALTLALAKADASPDNIAAIGAGISGYDRDSDLDWVESLIDKTEFDCPIKYVNDAAIAHIGAFRGDRGIIAICGTGSIVFGMDESGNCIRNYDFDDYAYSASRHLTQSFINRTLKSENGSTDEAVVSALLKHFNVSNVEGLSVYASEGKELRKESIPQQFGDFAKHITEGAVNGSRLSQLVCEDSALEVCDSIELVSGKFAAPIFDVALVGSVANSKYIFDFISCTISRKNYTVKRNIPLPEIGAVLMAMRECGINADESVLSNLKAI